MKIAIFPNLLKAQADAIAMEIVAFLHARGVETFAEEEEATRFNSAALDGSNLKEIDVIISLGGDGTILRICHKYKALEAPIMAINLGGFGFMADIPAKEALSSIKLLLAGRYTIEERIMMEGLSVHGDHCFAVNELVIHRSQNHCLIDLSIYVDGTYLNTFAADGVIIATPTGSTAYSLSAGGPILMPGVKALVLTPISAHTISNRPIVLMPQEKIEIQYISPYKPVEITADGYLSFKMLPEEIYTIKPSKRVFKLILLPDHNYPRILREKLGWSRKLKM